MARSFLFSLWITLSLFAQAQDVHRQIRGQIIDEDNNPLIGVAIMIEETFQAVMTDVEGNFQIKPRVDSGILLIRYLGIEPQQIDFALDEGEILDLGSIQVVFESISFTCCCCILVERYLTEDKAIWPTTFRAYNPDLRNGHNTYSELGILNGRVPGLSVPQAENPQAYDQSAYYGQTYQSMTNGMPLHPNSQMGNALLWELENQDVQLLRPQEGLAQHGLRGINGGFDYQYTSIEEGLNYRNAVGSGLQEHHLRYGLNHQKGRLGLAAHHVRGRFASLPDWQMTGGSIQHSFSHKEARFRSELQAGEVSWGDSFGERQTEQLASLHNRYNQTLGRNARLSLTHNSQWFRRANTPTDKGDPQHSLSLEVEHTFLDDRLTTSTGGEYFHSDFLRDAAYFGEAEFTPLQWLSFKAQARQEHLRLPQHEDLSATSYGGEIVLQAPDFSCAPSRANISLSSNRLHLAQNQAWLNRLNLSLPLHDLRIDAGMTLNRFQVTEALNLGWIDWQQLGQQRSLGAYLTLSGSNPIFLGNGNIRYWASYSYNQTQFNPYSVPLQSRQAYLGGNTLAFQMPQRMPSAVMALGQEMNWRNWRFHFNLWGWLQNQNTSLGNGLSLQEIQLSWGHAFSDKTKLSHCRLYLHGQHLFQLAEQSTFAQLPTQGTFNNLAQNPALLLGMEISLF